MLSIKVLGSGCPNCQKLEQETRKAVKNLAIDAEITHVTDYQQITNYGVMSTPGLVINEKVVSSGKIPTEAEIITFLANALDA
jgi:small redox-active disulfide protein 2